MPHTFQHIQRQTLAVLALLCQAFTLHAQSFSTGNLPAGKTIVVTCETDVSSRRGSVDIRIEHHTVDRETLKKIVTPLPE